MLSGDIFPNYVFSRLYERFLFIDISEALCNQAREFMEIICDILVETSSRRLLAYEVNNGELKFINEFNLANESSVSIADYFTNYRDEFDVPYYCLIASLLFTDENKQFCILGDRASDICIIGCSIEVYNLLVKYNSNAKSNRYFLNFMGTDEYLKMMRKYLNDSNYNQFNDLILANYGDFRKLS